MAKFDMQPVYGKMLTLSTLTFAPFCWDLDSLCHMWFLLPTGACIRSGILLDLAVFVQKILPDTHSYPDHIVQYL